MRVLLIGSGLIGVTAAYWLKLCGHEVTVVDRSSGAGREASLANGGLLTPSMAEPWNAPGSWRVLLGSLCRSDSPLQLRLRALPTLTSWGISFLRNSSRERFERNVLTNLRLALYSLQAMEELRERTTIAYGRSASGSLRIFRDQSSLDQAVAAAERLAPEGVFFRRLTPSDVTGIEPGLAPIEPRLCGGLYYGVDETGDAHRFCEALADAARRLGVEFHFDTEVQSLTVRSGRVEAAVAGNRRLVADRYVVAGGVRSVALLRSVSVSVPVRPAKGYSITFDVPEQQPLLRVPVVDDRLHAVVTPLSGAIRVAGTAEFAGFDMSLPEARVENLMRLIQEVLPQAHLQRSAARPWCGLRPMSADGVPVIGRTHIENLYVSTGHGHLGWTLAAGSAKLLASLMNGNDPEIDPTPFAPERFGSFL